MSQQPTWIGKEFGSLNKAKAEFFDAQADASWAAFEYTKEEKEKIDKALDSLPQMQGKTVLEPGCGTGRLTKILSQRVGSGGRVLALDISSKMLEAARKNTKGLNNIELAYAPLEEVVLPKGSVDLIFCHQVFPHFDHKEKALALMANLLKPKGILVIFHLINIEEINDLHRKAGTAVAADIMPSRETMQDLFKSAGLIIEALDDLGDLYFLLGRKT